VTAKKKFNTHIIAALSVPFSEICTMDVLVMLLIAGGNFTLKAKIQTVLSTRKTAYPF